MKQPNQVLKPVRWYAPTESVFHRLVRLGIRAKDIYEGWNGEHWSKFAMKRGEVLGVIDGYRAFGDTPRKLNKAVDRFHDQGATILDIETGHDSRAHGHILAAEAEGRMSAEYRRRMADERAEKRRLKSGGMPKREAQVEWKKPGIMSADERAKYIGIPRSTLYAMFGPSGAVAGRRPKHLIET